MPDERTTVVFRVGKQEDTVEDDNDACARSLRHPLMNITPSTIKLWSLFSVNSFSLRGSRCHILTLVSSTLAIDLSLKLTTAKDY